MALDEERLVKLIHESNLTFDDARDLIMSEGDEVLSVGWTGGSAGNSGAVWVRKWRGYFFIYSSDFDDQGPYETLEEVLSAECVCSPGTPEPDISSTMLSLDELKKLGLKMLTEEGETVLINGSFFKLRDGSLVPVGG